MIEIIFQNDTYSLKNRKNKITIIIPALLNTQKTNIMHDWQNYTVLLVEDDEMSYKYMELVLSRQTGINIIHAKTGQEAIDYSNENETIDIVLMDLQLPDVDGYRATKIIKAVKPYLPIIIQTANTWNDEKERCFAAGCDGYMTKPINLNSLYAQMDNFLRQYVPMKKRKIDTKELNS